MKNLLHVVNIYFTIPYFLGDQFKFFSEKGYGMHVACSPSEYLDDYAKKQGFQYLETPIDRSFSLSHDFLSVIKICRYIKKNKIDIVVGHTPKGALLAMISAWIMGVPKRIFFRHGLVYETCRGMKRRLLISADRLTSKLSTRIVCVGGYVLQRSLEDKLAPSFKQLTLGQGSCGGVDTVNKFNPNNVSAQSVEKLKRENGIGDNDFVIGYTGRLVKDKGIIELVKAFEMLWEKDKGIKLLLVGMFESRDALPDDVKRKILEHDGIIYTGFVNEGIESYYSIMSVYVLASYREGFGMGALEAQAMNVPVLTTSDTGCRDTIQPGLTGLYIKRDAEDIKNKIIEVMHGYPFNGCRDWVVSSFDCRLLWPEIEKLYT